jgi:hypothetical protein
MHPDLEFRKERQVHIYAGRDAHDLEHAHGAYREAGSLALASGRIDYRTHNTWSPAERRLCFYAHVQLSSGKVALEGSKDASRCSIIGTVAANKRAAIIVGLPPVR